MTAINRIERRFTQIEHAEDFLGSEDGVDKLDGITMMLIAIGELLKRLDRELDESLADRYPSVDWKGAKGVRDFLSHHYFAVDAEVIFDICENKIQDLKKAISTLQTTY